MEKVDFTFKKTGYSRVMAKRQADLLGKLGHGSYQTRMLTAALPVPADVTPTVAAPELDSAGVEWSADLHVASKLQNMNGTWRKKPGAAT